MIGEWGRVGDATRACVLLRFPSSALDRWIATLLLKEKKKWARVFRFGLGCKWAPGLFVIGFNL